MADPISSGPIEIPYDGNKGPRGYYCPLCGCLVIWGTSDMPPRKVCQKEKYQFWKSCQQEPHFHHKCKNCGGKWIEFPFTTTVTMMVRVYRSILRCSENKPWADTIRQRMISETTKDLCQDIMNC